MNLLRPPNRRDDGQNESDSDVAVAVVKITVACAHARRLKIFRPHNKWGWADGAEASPGDHPHRSGCTCSLSIPSHPSSIQL